MRIKLVFLNYLLIGNLDTLQICEISRYIPQKKIETISIPFNSLHPQAPDVQTLPRDLIYHHCLALNTGSKWVLFQTDSDLALSSSPARGLSPGLFFIIKLQSHTTHSRGTMKGIPVGPGTKERRPATEGTVVEYGESMG